MKTRSKDLIYSYILGILYGLVSFTLLNDIILSVILGSLFFLLMNFYTLKKLNEISDYLDKEQKDVLSNEELLINERLDLLDKYYDFPLYYVFKEIIVLYDTQGGNIIDMSMQLLSQIDIYMKNVETIYLDNNKKIGEVLFLWIFSTLALIYVKSILIDYYVVLIENEIFKYIIFGFFFLFIFSLYILSKKYIEIKLGE